MQGSQLECAARFNCRPPPHSVPATGRGRTCDDDGSRLRPHCDIDGLRVGWQVGIRAAMGRRWRIPPARQASRRAAAAPLLALPLLPRQQVGAQQQRVPAGRALEGKAPQIRLRGAQGTPATPQCCHRRWRRRTSAQQTSHAPPEPPQVHVVPLAVVLGALPLLPALRLRRLLRCRLLRRLLLAAAAGAPGLREGHQLGQHAADPAAVPRPGRHAVQPDHLSRAGG